MNNKEKIILGVCVLAFLAILVFGYKWIIEKIEETRKLKYRGQEQSSVGSGGSGTSSNSTSDPSSSSNSTSGSSSLDGKSSATNNENPTNYGVGETLYTFGEYATVRETPCINNGVVNNKLSEVRGLIGTITAVKNDTNGGAHKWYKVKLARPVRCCFIEYEHGYVRDDVVTNIK